MASRYTRKVGTGRGHVRRLLKQKDNIHQQQTRGNPRQKKHQVPATQKAKSDTALATLSASAASFSPIELQAEAAPVKMFSCIVCCEDRKLVEVGPCNHPMQCLECALTSRLLYGRTQCMVCKDELDKAVITASHDKPYQEFVQRALQFDPTLGVCFEDKASRDQARLIVALRCPECVRSGLDPFRTFRNVHALRKHVRVDHGGKTICTLCFEHRKVFPAKQLILTSQELNGHNLEAHPRCNLCAGRPRFFDQEALYEHRRKSHFSCHICDNEDSERDAQSAWFRSYEALFDHFSRKHFVCTHPSCLDKRFVVFASQIKLQAHLLSVHKDKSAHKLKLNFELAPSAQRYGSGSGSAMANGPAVREMRVESRESRARRQIERVRRLRLEVEQKLKRVLVTEARYEEFRSAAIKFRNKASTTSAYVSRCIELLGGKHTTKQLLLDFMSLLFSKPVQEELFREVERQLANPKKRMPAQQSVNHKHERQRAEQQTHQKKLHTRTKNAGPSQRRSNEAPAIPPAAASRPVTEAADRSRSSKPAVHIALSRTQKKAMLQLVNDTLAEAKCLHASGRGLNSHEKKQIQNCAAKFQTKYQREKEPLHKLLVLLESHFPQHSNGRSNRGDAHANADSAKAAWQRVVAEQVVCIVHDKISAPHVDLGSAADYHALRDADIMQKIFRWGRLLSTQFVPMQLHAAGKLIEFIYKDQMHENNSAPPGFSPPAVSAPPQLTPSLVGPVLHQHPPAVKANSNTSTVPLQQTQTKRKKKKKTKISLFSTSTRHR